MFTIADTNSIFLRKIIFLPIWATIDTFFFVNLLFQSTWLPFQF